MCAQPGFFFFTMPRSYLLIFSILLTFPLRAQDSTTTRRDTLITPTVGASAATDSVPASANGDSAADLLAGLAETTTEAQPLLPHKMLFTQRVFWGPKGLLRITNVAPLTPEIRAKELKVRRTMLVAHQIGGLVTLAGFVAQGILGSQLYNAEGDRYTRLRSAHQTTGRIINVTYFTTAGLSLFAPPPLSAERQRGLTSIRLHKYLSVIHLGGMILTNVLANRLGGNFDSAEKYQQTKSAHRIAAYTTFAAYAVSVIVLKF
jgi:hypothetical protein